MLRACPRSPTRGFFYAQFIWSLIELLWKEANWNHREKKTRERRWRHKMYFYKKNEKNLLLLQADFPFHAKLQHLSFHWNWMCCVLLFRSVFLRFYSWIKSSWIKIDKQIDQSAKNAMWETDLMFCFIDLIRLRVVAFQMYQLLDVIHRSVCVLQCGGYFP